MQAEKDGVGRESLRSSCRRWRSKFTMVIFRSSCALSVAAACVGDEACEALSMIWAMDGGTSGGIIWSACRVLRAQ